MWIAKLKALKRKAKTTYLDIAKTCKVPKSRVSKWFNGDAIPDTTSIDIMYEKFFGGLYAADRLEALFSYAYDEKHNVDGQISMCEVNEEPKETNAVVPVKVRQRGVLNAYYDRQRELLYLGYMSTEQAKSLGITWEEED